MEIVDANVILRYLLNDEKEHFHRAKNLLEERTLYVPFEVIAEVVYVLEKVYDIPSGLIVSALYQLSEYPNIVFPDLPVLQKAMNIYDENNIDFVDSILIAYSHIRGYQVHSFDNKLNKLLD